MAAPVVQVEETKVILRAESANPIVLSKYNFVGTGGSGISPEQYEALAKKAETNEKLDSILEQIGNENYQAGSMSIAEMVGHTFEHAAKQGTNAGATNTAILAAIPEECTEDEVKSWFPEFTGNYDQHVLNNGTYADGVMTLDATYANGELTLNK